MLFSKESILALISEIDVPEVIYLTLTSASSAVSLESSAFIDISLSLLSLSPSRKVLSFSRYVLRLSFNLESVVSFSLIS